VKVALCTPLNGPVSAGFHQASLEMVAWSMAQNLTVNNAPARLVIEPIQAQADRSDLARNLIAEQALAENVDYLLWTDPALAFPRRAFFALACRDLGIVGCSHPSKAGEAAAAANYVDGELVPIEISEDKRPEAVDLLGLGFALMRAEIFAALPRPWFKPHPLGDHVHFCEQARAHGLQPYVDHSLSTQIRAAS
jgi:hypothetical protein